MLEFHLGELNLFDAARFHDRPVRSLSQNHPGTSTQVLGRDDVLAIETECRRERMLLLDRTDEAYCSSAQGRDYASWLTTAAPADLICTRKGDTSLDDVHRYIVRDSVQWLTMWTAGYRKDSLWHAMAKAVALLAVLDDIVIAPSDVADGTHRIGGESLGEVLDRIKLVAGDRDVRWLDEAYKETLFSSRIQFHEKWSAAPSGMAAPSDFNAIQAYLREPDVLRASITRTYAAETLPVMYLLAYYYRISFDECDWASFIAASVAQTLGMDISKDQHGVGVKEVTNFGERPEEAIQGNLRRRSEIYDVFLQLADMLRSATGLAGLVCDRYSRVSLSYGRLVDRYIERRDMTRLPMSADLSLVVKEVMEGH
ncbi:hypothetical protein EES40_35800 [Streptomyces sp. ADI93-02]|nr:hypothetical protein EES40_35800 [Streptomyces sp. ADI93-02]